MPMGAMKIRGFTLIEVVVVIIVVGTMAATILPRFANQADFNQRGYYDQLRSAIQFARKAAVATRRYACVTVDATGATFSQDPTLPESVVAPNCASTLVIPGASCTAGKNKVCPPSGALLEAVAPTVFPVTFNFDPLGRASAKVTMAVTGQATITVEQETGYVH